ncbi:MAG: phosphomannomutase/phosphoglucomutase [Gammaproteobacteria bacterium]|nr:phosphomannomutase/phosphoglucomutase [Gammaproteobacteria bacterium]MBT8074590.1 phosphomannomutase/phosphoglucomutase [Gammaproteobacteria bacterium]MBT8076424.1 phosphomannomutase/phosphoglucomutase [Gammaproteobacteria bacterium]
MAVPHKKALPPVELVESIFRAYDIRGIVGETLDADVARQVGQCVGSIAVDKDAGPVVVARDGRESGSDLVAGMIEGIASTGCDVIDIGAVPTGVLYFAAYELGSGTGVMVTGSHNPPDYNGFKILIGGVTWAGEQITDMFTRIQSGNLRVGKGKISEQDMLDSYRERISGDIQLKKPLKVVADCGNGIGGICAVDVLRDIGADVMALFDEVDGTFPNHHPDPSEPENLQDLIEAVRLMDADIGVAFDGDADRLGVVTSTGEIIYSDRLMMLFVEDILSRVPGSTIIYDVKCTGHLHYVIEEAGGKPMMYKTGHSLIKNKMKEVNAPFAGEMSGHFFFKERWYGFDCGIYSAARLLEILAADERDAREVLNSLPNSVSTPELKVQMEEGENHAFVAELQQKARFADARITTIDGLRADFVDGWGLVRASNTTPILVCRFDAEDETALQRIKEVFKVQMLAINDQLELPF